MGTSIVLLGGLAGSASAMSAVQGAKTYTFSPRPESSTGSTSAGQSSSTTSDDSPAAPGTPGGPLATFGSVSKSPAPVSGTLTIVVTGSDDKPMAGAHVSLDDYYSEATGTKGTAAFSGLYVGSHSITVTRSGKRTITESISLGAGQNKHVAVKLVWVPPMGWVYGLIALLVVAGGAWLLNKHQLLPRLRRSHTVDGTPVRTAETIVIRPQQR